MGSFWTEHGRPHLYRVGPGITYKKHVPSCTRSHPGIVCRFLVLIAGAWYHR